jgi:hypothetical protein
MAKAKKKSVRPDNRSRTEKVFDSIFEAASEEQEPLLRAIEYLARQLDEIQLGQVMIAEAIQAERK